MRTHVRAIAGNKNGQILPLFVIFLIVLFGMSALVIDGGFMLESKHDLQTVAQHAADSGAQMMDVTAYKDNCVGRTSLSAPNADPLCQSKLSLAQAAASGRAQAVAKSWIDSLDTSTLRLPSLPSSNEVSVSVTGDSITVTVTRCYRPYLIDIILGALGPGHGCPSGTIAISASATATAAEGY